MKTLISSIIIILTLSLTSCGATMISDEGITIIKQNKIRRNYYYKYYYTAIQHGLEIRIYSNNQYKEGQIVKIQ